jgi:uroporphyrinogen III methyltransferase/synthase
LKGYFPRALVARAKAARDVLPDALRSRGAEVEVLPVYETVIERLDGVVAAIIDAATGPPPITASH